MHLLADMSLCHAYSGFSAVLGYSAEHVSGRRGLGAVSKRGRASGGKEMRSRGGSGGRRLCCTHYYFEGKLNVNLVTFS